MKRIQISDMHYDSLLKLSKKYRIKLEQLLEKMIEENYNSKVRR